MSRDRSVPKMTPYEYASDDNNLEKFSFMFTRDPFDRALSGYFNKILPRNTARKNTSLDEFFMTVIERKTENKHFIKQLTICDPCLLNMSFLGRTETMNEDLDYIINDLTRMHETVFFSANGTQTNQNISINKSQYDKGVLKTLSFHNLLAFIYEYRFDYVAFGYNPYHAILKYQEIYS